MKKEIFSRRLRRNLSRWFALYATMAVIPSPYARAGTIAVNGDSTNKSYGFIYTHLDIPGNATHTFTSDPNNWVLTGSITEKHQDGGKDTIVIDGAIQHVSDPPVHAGEGVNGNKPTFKISFEAGAADDDVQFEESKLKTVKHKDHFDGVFAGGGAKVDNNKDIISYNFGIVGKHEATEEDLKPGKSSEPTGTGPSGKLLNATWMLVPSASQFTIALGLVNMHPTNIQSAHIRLGTPSSPGTVIFDLNAAAFIDLGGLGTGRIILDAPFPPSNVSDLLGDNTFVDLVTSLGTYQAQLIFVPPPPEAPIPTVSQWGLIIMTFLILIAATIVFARRGLAMRKT